VPKYYLEAFSTDWTAEYGPRRVSREEIIGFAAQFDPQPMHLDEEAARHTMLGGLAASGWHTCCIMMKMIADGLLLDTASMGAPGIDEVKWLRPVRPATISRCGAACSGPGHRKASRTVASSASSGRRSTIAASA